MGDELNLSAQAVVGASAERDYHHMSYCTKYTHTHTYIYIHTHIQNKAKTKHNTEKTYTHLQFSALTQVSQSISSVIVRPIVNTLTTHPHNIMMHLLETLLSSLFHQPYSLLDFIIT